MRYGICTDPENIELLEQTGYDYIELNASKMLTLSEEELAAVKEKLDISNIKCEAVNVLFPKTMSIVGGETTDEELTEFLHKAMKMIQYLGAEVAVFGSGKVRICPEHLNLGQGYQELVKKVRLTGEIAAQYGVKIVIEPLSRAETNLINTMSEGAILESDVDHENVGLLSDFYHVMTNHDSIESMESIKKFGHIHIAAAHGRRYPLSEEGEEYRKFFQTLKKIGYTGRVSIEGKTDEIEKDAVTALALLRKLEEYDYE
jgi:D-psicose/D-tagatose/L-ribulose 3-epimerase